MTKGFVELVGVTFSACIIQLEAVILVNTNKTKHNSIAQNYRSILMLFKMYIVCCDFYVMSVLLSAVVEIATHYLTDGSCYICYRNCQLSLAIPPWVCAMSTGQRAVMLCDW